MQRSIFQIGFSDSFDIGAVLVSFGQSPETDFFWVKESGPHQGLVRKLVGRAKGVTALVGWEK